MKQLRTHRMRSAITAFLCGLMVLYTAACTYYKVAVQGPKDIPALAEKQSQKIMYLHNGSDVYLIKSMIINQQDSIENLTMELTQVNIVGYLKPHDTDYPKKNTPAWDTIYAFKQPIYFPGRPKRYIASTESDIAREVHFYLEKFTKDLASGTVKFPASAFKEVHVVEKDANRTTVEIILITLGTVAITVGILTALLIHAINTKSSCPYVYAFDGEQFVFQGELYSGAVLRNLERADHLPMPLLQPAKGEYRLRIANELKERQFVNLAELQAIRHPEGVQALFDVYGAPQLIARPMPPVQAVSALGKDLRPLMVPKDQQAFLFDEENAPGNSATLSFRNQTGATHAKLVLTAKNSFWFDQLFGRFIEKYGDAYPAWVQLQENMSREQRIQKQNEQDFPLSVYLKTGDGQWQLAGRFPLAGPLGWRDMVLPLDPAMLQDETVEIRLETGYRFWEVDYAAIDFSENKDMEVVTMPVKSARDQDGNTQLQALASDDGQYLEQLRTGNYTEMRFKALYPPKGQTQTLFLHNKGYYEHVRDFQGTPQTDVLGKFRQPHYFDQFSKTEYRQFISGIRIESDL